jgi:uncharacterized protein YjgD (DUF1641 family)
MSRITDQQLEISELNKKLDLVLDHLQIQQQKAAVIDDLIADLSLIGKDMYDTAVTKLEDHLVEIDPDQLRELTIKLLKNIPVFIRMIDTIESVTDLVKDAGPMVNEMIIDFTRKLHELEQKGYFGILLQAGKAMDNVVTTLNSLKADSFPKFSFWKLIKELRSPEMRRALTFLIIIMKNLGKTGQ